MVLESTFTHKTTYGNIQSYTTEGLANPKTHVLIFHDIPGSFNDAVCYEASRFFYSKECICTRFSLYGETGPKLPTLSLTDFADIIAQLVNYHKKLSPKRKLIVFCYGHSGIAALLADLKRIDQLILVDPQIFYNPLFNDKTETINGKVLFEQGIILNEKFVNESKDVATQLQKAQSYPTLLVCAQGTNPHQKYLDVLKKVSPNVIETTEDYFSAFTPKTKRLFGKTYFTLYAFYSSSHDFTTGENDPDRMFDKVWSWMSAQK